MPKTMETIDQKLARLGNTIRAKNAETIISDALDKNNLYTKMPVRGILTKPQHERDGTKFKLVVWYNFKRDGITPFSVIEKNNNLNRKYHDSIDFVPQQCEITKEIEYVTRHDLAFEKLFNHLTYYANRIDKALMFVNDWTNNQQLTIIKWHNNMNHTKFVNPLFDAKKYAPHVYYNGLSCAALKIDELK